jgi:hypothetical protein
MQSLNDLKDVDSMQHEILVRPDEAAEDGAGPATYEEALRLAVTEEMPASGDNNSQGVPTLQDSPGDLNPNPDPGEQQGSIREYFADVPLALIQGISPIPDYTLKTAAPHPILAKTLQGYFYLDGQDLIAEARANGRESIRCYVSDLPDHSVEELALRKVVVRERAPGGEPLYAERIRNVCRLFVILSQSPDVRVYGHGGDRRGENYQQQSTLDNVISVIAERLGKSTTTINMLRNFGEHLDEPTLEMLVQERVTKDFFEKVTVNKRTLLKYLMHEGKNELEITAVISPRMMEWLAEYQRDGKIETVFPQTQSQDPGGQSYAEQPSDAQPQNDQQGDEGEPPESPPPEAFDHWSGSQTQETQVTFESLKEEAIAACDAFRNQLGAPELQLGQFCELLTGHARRLMQIALKAQGLSESSSPLEEES